MGDARRTADDGVVRVLDCISGDAVIAIGGGCVAETRGPASVRRAEMFGPVTAWANTLRRAHGQTRRSTRVVTRSRVYAAVGNPSPVVPATVPALWDATRQPRASRLVVRGAWSAHRGDPSRSRYPASKRSSVVLGRGRELAKSLRHLSRVENGERAMIAGTPRTRAGLTGPGGGLEVRREAVANHRAYEARTAAKPSNRGSK